MKQTTIKELKKGDFFTLKANECPNDSSVYIKGNYDRGSKTYSCYKFEDINEERFYKANKKVYTDFIF